MDAYTCTRILAGMFRGRACQCASGLKIEGSRASRRRGRRGFQGSLKREKEKGEARDLFARISTCGRCRGHFQGMHFAFGIFHGICSARGEGRGFRTFDQRNQSPRFVIVFVGPGTTLAMHLPMHFLMRFARSSTEFRRVLEIFALRIHWFFCRETSRASRDPRETSSGSLLVRCVGTGTEGN